MTKIDLIETLKFKTREEELDNAFNTHLKSTIEYDRLNIEWSKHTSFDIIFS
jgi:hypothetical protein